MPSITLKSALSFVLIGLILAAAGCGEPNETATYDPEEQYHPADWLPARHAVAAQEDLNSCRRCHGQDLVSGGIVKVGCNQCHIGGPTAVHPPTFAGFPWLEGGHGRYVAQNGTGSCRNVWCHGSNLQGVAQSGNSCRECHDFP
jgi:hypothetical protein